MLMKKVSFCVMLFALMGLVAVQLTDAQPLLLSENFNDLALQPFVNEGGGDGTDWTKTPPTGWTTDDSQMPNGGVTEWWGWSFANVNAWASVDDQRRSEFTNASETIAVADSDEWDDMGHDEGTFNSFLSTPSISLTDISDDRGVLYFDSSWRPEGEQLATVTISFDGGDRVEIMRWTSTAGPNYHDHMTNERVRIPFDIPDGASSMVFTWGYTNADNNWWWAIDNVIVAAGLPSALVERSFSSPVFSPGQSTSVSLAVSLTDAKDTTIVETLPEGWTAENISDGGIFADGEITWNLTSFSGSTTLTYEVVPAPDSDYLSEIRGMVDQVLPVYGASILTQMEGVGSIFENHIDIGDVATSGDAAFANDEYEVTGSGSGIGGIADEFHFVFTEVSGAFTIRASEVFIDPGMGDFDNARAGLMIRDSLTPDSSYGYALIRSSDFSLLPQWRTAKGESAQDLGRVIGTDNVEIERIGSSINFYYVNMQGEREFIHSVTLTDLEDPVYVGLAVTSNSDGNISTGFFSDVELITYPFELFREFPGTTFPWNSTLEGVRVSLNVKEGETANVVVRETPPAGWIIANAQASAGQVNDSNGEIVWTVNNASGQQTLTYDVTAVNDEVVGQWSGEAVSGNNTLRISGASLLYAGIPPEYEILLAEDFEGLELGPFVEESGGDGTDWTNVPPEGWTVDNSRLAGFEEGLGRPEWRGWTFADKNSWASVEDQRRSEFYNAVGTIAVADSDEWDDSGSPSSLGTFNSYLSTPPISLEGLVGDKLIISFDSSWRPENEQKANLTISFDGGDPVEVFLWTSNPADSTYNDDNSTSENVFYAIDVPTGAAEMVATWGYFDAGNNWWWAIDNILIAADLGETGVNDWFLFNTKY